MAPRFQGGKPAKRASGKSMTLAKRHDHDPAVACSKASIAAKQRTMKKPAAAGRPNKGSMAANCEVQGTLGTHCARASDVSMLARRKRLFFKQPDPLKGTATLLAKLQRSTRKLPKNMRQDDNLDGSETLERAYDTNQLEAAMRASLQSEECTLSNDFQNCARSSESAGVSSSQLALTLLMSTMSAAQAPASTEQCDIPKHTSQASIVEVPSDVEVSSAESCFSSMLPVPQAMEIGPDSLPPDVSPGAKSGHRSSAKSSSSSSSSASSSSDEASAPAVKTAVAGSSPAGPEASPELIAQCFEKIHDAILLRLPTVAQDDNIPILRDHIRKVAREIAIAFGSQWGQMKNNPRLQLRTLLWNLRDPQNPDFVRLVVAREIAPQQLPRITSEEMASAAKQSERTVLREKHVQESTLIRGFSGVVDQGALQAYKALVSRK